jgi:hypothetical protein
MIDEAAIQGIIEATGCPCQGAGHAGHAGATMSPQARLKHLRHGVDVQPITMGTKQDRMQYELAATPIHAQHTQHAAVPPAGHAGMDHSQHAGMDHGAMGHDMSDPSMAAAMERDMRNTFFIALLLTEIARKAQELRLLLIAGVGLTLIVTNRLRPDLVALLVLLGLGISQVPSRAAQDRLRIIRRELAVASAPTS